MLQVNRAMRRHPEALDWLPGMPKVGRQQALTEAGALPLAAYPSRRLKRLEARKRAKVAAGRPAAGGVA